MKKVGEDSAKADKSNANYPSCLKDLHILNALAMIQLFVSMNSSTNQKEKRKGTAQRTSWISFL